MTLIHRHFIAEIINLFSSETFLLQATHVWMLFHWDVDLLCLRDDGSVRLGQHQGLLGPATDLEKRRSNFADFCKAQDRQTGHVKLSSLVR